MPRIGFMRFDEKGQIKQEMVEVTSGQLSCSCWLPARFLGGTCDRFYICKYAVKVSCKATASKMAENILADIKEKQAGGNKIEEEPNEKAEAVTCQSCGEIIKLDKWGDGIYYGEEGTNYEGKPFCESCYCDDEACATVYFGGDDSEPNIISSCRNETQGDFTVTWHSTDPWRGYYELKSDKYVEVFTDAILSGHESEEMLRKLYDILMERFDQEDIDFARAFCRSSNVFMTSLEIWVVKSFEQLVKAHLIINDAKEAVDFDNDLYKTGILIPREALERFKALMKGKYEVSTDDDLAKIVAEKGHDLIEEIKETISKKEA